MTTKYEHAKNRAERLSKKRIAERRELSLTGRVIVVGDDTDNFGDPHDPRTYNEVVTEYTWLGRHVARIKLSGRDANDREYPTTREGNPTMTHAEWTKMELKKNSLFFKLRPSVKIFDANGIVKKRTLFWNGLRSRLKRK